LGQAITFLRVAITAIVVLWAIGALVVIAAPVILPRIRRLLDGRRH
jgi:protein required for attachment to host cells